ncbi:MAG: aldolase/citrate lyase family protein [Jannaschia sp.]
MSELVRQLNGDVPVFAVNPGGLSVPVADALGGMNGTALFIDCERTALGVHEASCMARAARASGLFSLLRTESAEPAIVTRYLDCRIDALVVPQIESAAQCADLAAVLQVHAATFPRTAFIAQIESVPGHAALDDILSAPGIDAILIGPNDLSASMGLAGQPGHADVRAAVEDIAGRVRKVGLPFGLPVVPATARAWADRGARLFYLSLETLLTGGLGILKEKLS